MIDSEQRTAIQTMMSQGKFMEAETTLRSAIAQVENESSAYELLGDCLRRAGRNDDAAVAYSSFVALEPDNVFVRLRLANLEFGRAHYDAAISHYSRISLTNCDYSTKAAALEMWSASLFRLGRTHEALNKMRLALEIPEPTPHYLRMTCSMARLATLVDDAEAATAAQHKVFDMMGWSAAFGRGYNFTKELWFASNVENFRFVYESLESAGSVASRRLLEIGSFQGMSTCYMLDNWFKAHDGILVCIDPEYQKEFRENISRSLRPDCLIAITARSQDALPVIAPGFDFVHIDGLHVAAQVFIDGILSAPLLKVGGFIVFDDYLKEDQSGLGQTVKRGVDEFCKVAGKFFAIVRSNRQLICRLEHPLSASELIAQSIEFLRQRQCWHGVDAPRPSDYSSVADFVQAEHESFNRLFAIKW